MRTSIFSPSRVRALNHFYSALLFLTVFVFIRSAAAVTNRQAPGNLIDITASPSGNYTNLLLTLPQTADLSSVRIVLNGKEISTRFEQMTCSQAACLSGNISEVDGLRPEKNVVYATAKTADGGMTSGRFRFSSANEAVKVSSLSHGMLRSLAQPETTASDMSAGFLPPTITFQTLNGGGWDGNGPWLQVGSAQYPAVGATNCSGARYLLLIFERQTLQPIQDAPAMCIASGSGLTTDFNNLKRTDPGALVVVGTLSGQVADSTLDTSLIGGSSHTNDTPAPGMYMAIGVIGATPGTAYENFNRQVDNTSTLYTPMYAFATGVVQEDENGNYNFESSDVLEYTVDGSPADTATGPAPITVGAFQAQTQANPGLKGFRLTAPSVNSARGGYWLLVVQRDSPWAPIKSPNPCTRGEIGPDGMQPITNCGAIYPTGDTADSTGATRKKAYEDLANALTATGPYDLVFLASWGFPACCGSQLGVVGNGSGTSNGFYEFRDALQTLGGSGRATLFSNNYNSQGFAFITSRGMGEPLVGHSAGSSTYYSDAGQAGYLHGTLARNLNGLYQPFQSSQQLSAQDDKIAGPDFTLTTLATRQPVSWPELSGLVIPGADSAAGQHAAYAYISYSLITNYYIKGASGSYLDDIHYFFTGSNSNYINYHYFDPANLPWPGGSSTSFAWTDPVTNQSLSFTQNDFKAVASQVSQEIVDVTNVMNFMVTGPVNMKDMIASGHANAGLALTAAASNVLSSSLKGSVSNSTPVKLDVGNVINLLGGVASVASALAGAPGVYPAVTAMSGVLGGLLTSSGAAVDLQSGGAEILPSRYTSFTTTIGDLANADLQGQLGIGFDITLDSILADWSKLNTLGPKITDSSLPAFYSPNQVAQNGAVQMLTKASERSFYMALVPTVYSVDFWPSFYGSGNDGATANVPDMGSYHPGLENTCNQFYSTPAPTYSYQWTATPGGFPQPDWSNGGKSPAPADYSIIRGAISQRATTELKFAWMDASLAQQLFSPSGLNIPFDLFVTPYGPMSGNYNDMSAWADPTHLVLNNITGYSPQNIASCSGLPSSSLGGVGSSPLSPVATTTVLSIPPASLLGEPLTLKATVAAGGNLVTTGSIIFLEGATTVSTGTLDATGTATTTLASPMLGQHSYRALYARVEPYDASASATTAVTVYANAPSLDVSLSTQTLSISYGAASSPLTVKAQSLYGMTGTVTFSCSGVPIGMSCNFSPAQTTLHSGSAASTTLTIRSSTTSGSIANASKAGFAAVLPLALFTLLPWWSRRKWMTQMLSLATLVALIGPLTGCSGGSSAKNPIQETGTKTILITATSGSISKSMPLVVNIQ